MLLLYGYFHFPLIVSAVELFGARLKTNFKTNFSLLVMVVVLPDSFGGMGSWKNPSETYQLDHASINIWNRDQRWKNNNQKWLAGEARM